MHFRYSEWRAENDKKKQDEELRKLFNYLLLQTSGDVEEAVEWLKYLNERYQLFGDESELQKFIKRMEKEGFIKRELDRYVVTTKGTIRIRRDSLIRVFSGLKKGGSGNHPTFQTGQGVERLTETRPYQFGDKIQDLNITATMHNALLRHGVEEFTLREDDLEVYESEHLTSCSTILMIDISHSMILYGEDRITPAKQVGLALSELILTQFRKDKLRVLAFGDEAKEIQIEDLPFLQVGPYYTNTKAGLQVARQMLRREKNPNKQIFMITDGKPSAITERGKTYRHSFGLDPRIVNQTLNEAVACRRDGISICTFMIARDPYLVRFVEQLTQCAKGRAYYSSLDKLGDYVFVDYLKNRKRRVK